LRTISPIAIGTSHVPARTFMLLNAISATVWGVLFTGMGYLFGDTLLDAVHSIMPKHKLAGVAILALVLAIAMAVVRYWRGRRSNA
jgi:membrane protein DedA with SNARE-associated domain